MHNDRCGTEIQAAVFGEKPEIRNKFEIRMIKTGASLALLDTGAEDVHQDPAGSNFEFRASDFLL
jgi:hypothetical protein